MERERCQVRGLKTGKKFSIDDAFVLIPSKDPIALEALRTYRSLTPDKELKAQLSKCIAKIDHRG
jgi:hypothetical protein